jgi:predicted phosphoribosyltransferase
MAGRFYSHAPDSGAAGWMPDASGRPAAGGPIAGRLPPPELPFSDRGEAGRELARRLRGEAGADGLLVLGLPRGGVPVASEVASALDAALDVFVVRKLGVPGREELAFGAVASGGVRALNQQVVRSFGIPAGEVEAVAVREEQEVRARDIAYRGGEAALPTAGRPVIVVDDGMATGATMRAAVEALRSQSPEERPRRLVVAVPVAPREACADLLTIADDVVCAATPEPFAAVGLWYRDFEPVSTDEVRRLLRSHRVKV